MQIDFTGHGVDVTPALRQLTTSKFDKLIRHFDKITSINVTFNVEKLRQIVEASICIPKAKTIYASSESEDMYTAVDELINKLDRKILKHKEKLKNHHHD